MTLKDLKPLCRPALAGLAVALCGSIGVGQQPSSSPSPSLADPYPNEYSYIVANMKTTTAAGAIWDF